MDVRHCSLCVNNFYNGNNPMGVQRCWLLDTAELKPMYRISVNAPMGVRANYERVQAPSCCHQIGYIHLDAIPEYAQ